ncbi:MAG TPA: hypothetical protein DCZ88_00430 [Pseudanabaena sp.]|nr:hypothetical protein [Pseudanabaena sp.]
MADRISWTGGISMAFYDFLRYFVAISPDKVSIYQGIGNDFFASYIKSIKESWNKVFEKIYSKVLTNAFEIYIIKTA